MKSLPVVQRHPALRWLVPLIVIATAGAVLVEVFQPDDTSSGVSLPTLSAAQLVTLVRSSDRQQFTGTAIAQLSPAAANLTALAAVSAPATSLVGMAAGSHTLRVWYGGASRQRVALIGPLAETDVFRDGTSTWQWNSADAVAVHSRTGAASSQGIWTATVTPVELADRLLDTARRDTSISVAGAEEVAGRPAYTLVLRPTNAGTLVDYARVALDGRTKTPLAVQIYPRGSGYPALDVSFTDVRFGPVPSSVFQFRPPAGAKLERGIAPVVMSSEYGSGWTAVVCLHTTRSDIVPGLITDAPTAVSVEGTWGRGRLVRSDLLTALTTKDGRTFVGPVQPDVLYAAAAQ